MLSMSFVCKNNGQLFDIKDKIIYKLKILFNIGQCIGLLLQLPVEILGKTNSVQTTGRFLSKNFLIKLLLHNLDNMHGVSLYAFKAGF